MRKRDKSYIYFFIAALFMQLMALMKKIFDPDVELEVTLFDNYLLLDELILIQSFAVFYFLLGLGYWLLYKFRKLPNRTMAIVHTAITVGGLAFYFLCTLVLGFLEDDSYTTYYGHNDTLVMLMLPVFAAAQLVFIINMFIGSQTPYRRHRQKKTEY